MKFWVYSNTTSSTSLKRKLHPDKETQMINWHKTTKDNSKTLKSLRERKLSHGIYFLNNDKNKAQEQIVKYELQDYLEWYKNEVSDILEIDDAKLLKTDKFWLLDFSFEEDDYLRKQNIEFFMLLDEKNEIRIKTHDNKIDLSSRIVIDYIVDWKLKDYKSIPLFVLAKIIWIKEKNPNKIINTFLINYWYKETERFDWIKKRKRNPWNNYLQDEKVA